MLKNKLLKVIKNNKERTIEQEANTEIKITTAEEN